MEEEKNKQIDLWDNIIFTNTCILRVSEGEESEIELPTSVGSLKKQESS